MKTLLIVLSFFISVSVNSQNITNTLGTSGVFSIKDASSNYLTLSQSNGQVNILRSLRLENTTSSSLGILFKGPDRFLHNYGTGNTFLGVNSGNFTMTGINNSALGGGSLFSNATGSDNTALGSQSLYSNTHGVHNTAVGGGSLYSNTTGYQNTSVGWKSLFNNTIGQDNTALGSQSLYWNIDGIYNTAVGGGSLFSNTTGQDNTAVGWKCLFYNTLGYYNAAVGLQSLYHNVDGFYNTALGNLTLHSNITGSYNTAVGFQSLNTSTGNYNTALGFSSGSLITTGTNLTCIGNNAEPTSESATNQITLGNNQITSLRCNVQTITSLSDARDKKNIKDLSLGIDFIMKIKPRLFNWDKREWYENNISNGSKVKEELTAGFIAQELDDVQTNENAEWLNLVLKDNPDKMEATYGNLLPVIVKAIQELKVEGEKLKVENIELKNKNDKLSSDVQSLKAMNEKLISLEKIVNEMNSLKHTSLNEIKTSSTEGVEK